MKKALLCIVLAITCVYLSIGQNIRGDKQKFTYERLPLTPLPASVKSYKLETMVPEFPFNSYSFNRQKAVEQLKKSTKMDGYPENNAAADLEILVKVEPFYYSHPTVNSRTAEETRDKVTIKVTYYWVEVQHQLPVHLRMTNKIDNQAIHDNYVGNSRDFQTFRTPEFRTSTEAVNYYESQKSGHLQKLIESSFNDAANRVSFYVKNNFDFAKVGINQEVLTAKHKKEDYSDLDTAQAVALRAYALITPDAEKGFAAFAISIQPAIEIWTKVLSEADVDNKKARIDAKVANSIMHNLSDAYIWLNDFEKALNLIAKADENGKRDYWVADARKFAADRKLRLERNSQSGVNEVTLSTPEK